MRALAVLVAAAAVATCSSSVSAGTAGPTALRVVFWADSARTAPDATWTLMCNPAGGTLARPARACARLAAGGAKLFAPVPRGVACTQIYGGPQKARVTGLVAGRHVWAVLTRTDGCQVGRWNRLVPWLLPPGGAAA